MEFKGLNGVEYSYEKRLEGRYLRNRVLFNVLAVIATIALCAMCVIVKLLVYVTPVMFLLCLILYSYLKAYFQISYYYKIEGGAFKMSIKYGDKKSKPYYTVDLRKCEVICPAEEAVKTDITYDSCISRKDPTPELYVIIYENDGGKKTAAYFEATREALKVMKYYKPDTVISEKLRH